MSKNVRLGAFILGALVIFTVAIFIIGDRQFAFSRTYRLHAPFDNVAGLDEGAVVRAGGVRIGAVEEIQMPRRAGDKVTVVMELENSTREVIKKDSVASIETEGLLGNKYLSLSFGSGASEPVRDGDRVQSRPPLDYADLAKKANEIMDTTKVALGNVDAATADLKTITAKIDQGQGTIGALVNDKEVYHNLSATTADARRTMAEAKVGVVAFQENMEALKHNWFFRGFFNKRGYFDASEPAEHAIGELPNRPVARKFIFYDKDLFDKPETAKLKKEKILNQAGLFLEQNPFSLAVVVAYTGMKGEKEENLTLTRARAMVIRQYLAQKFKVDDARIKTKGMGETTETDPSKASRVEIVVYPGGPENQIIKTGEAKNQR